MNDLSKFIQPFLHGKHHKSFHGQQQIGVRKQMGTSKRGGKAWAKQ